MVYSDSDIQSVWRGDVDRDSASYCPPYGPERGTKGQVTLVMRTGNKDELGGRGCMRNHSSSMSADHFTFINILTIVSAIFLLQQFNIDTCGTLSDTHNIPLIYPCIVINTLNSNKDIFGSGFKSAAGAD